MRLELVIPIRTVNELNDHTHWRVRQRRAKEQRRVTSMVLSAYNPSDFALPCVVIMSRMSPRRMDSDSAVASNKFVRDAIADWLGVDDGSTAVDWQYGEQLKGPYCVHVTIVGGTGA